MKNSAQYHVAELWKRCLALVIDLAVCFVLAKGLVVLFSEHIQRQIAEEIAAAPVEPWHYMPGSEDQATIASAVKLVYLLGFFFLAGIAYHVFLETSGWRATLGKKLFGIEVVGVQNQKPVKYRAAILRILIKSAYNPFLTGLFFGMGIIGYLLGFNEPGVHYITVAGYFCASVLALWSLVLLAKSKERISLHDKLAKSIVVHGLASKPLFGLFTARYRRCPECAERIRMEAKKCHFCGAVLMLAGTTTAEAVPIQVDTRNLIAHDKRRVVGWLRDIRPSVWIFWSFLLILVLASWTVDVVKATRTRDRATLEYQMDHGYPYPLRSYGLRFHYPGGDWNCPNDASEPNPTSIAAMHFPTADGTREIIHDGKLICVKGEVAFVFGSGSINAATTEDVFWRPADFSRVNAYLVFEPERFRSSGTRAINDIAIAEEFPIRPWTREIDPEMVPVRGLQLPMVSIIRHHWLVSTALPPNAAIPTPTIVDNNPWIISPSCCHADEGKEECEPEGEYNWLTSLNDSVPKFMAYSEGFPSRNALPEYPGDGGWQWDWVKVYEVVSQRRSDIVTIGFDVFAGPFATKQQADAWGNYYASKSKYSFISYRILEYVGNLESDEKIEGPEEFAVGILVPAEMGVDEPVFRTSDGRELVFSPAQSSTGAAFTSEDESTVGVTSDGRAVVVEAKQLKIKYKTITWKRPGHRPALAYILLEVQRQ
jgi:uncharacterized RDD family membrane protein YckC